MASTMNASVSSSASIDSLTSGSTEGAEGDEDVAVRVCSNGSHLLFRSSLQRVWEHNHGETRMPVVRGDPSAMRLELRGDHDHGGLGETFDEDGVVDTPRRARSSVAETDDAAVDQARPLVEVSPRPL